MIDADRASLAEISAAISIFPQTFTRTLSESRRASRPIVSEFVVHRFSAAYRLRLRFSSSIEVSAIVLNWRNAARARSMNFVELLIGVGSRRRGDLNC
jgi:hypothetical protein